MTTPARHGRESEAHDRAAPLAPSVPLTPSGTGGQGVIHATAHALLPLLRLLARKSRSEYFDPVEFLYFCCVGLANTALDFCVYLAASMLVPLYAARTISWAVACSFSYLVNKRWVFRAGTRGRAAIPRFIAVNALGLALGLGLMELFAWWGYGRIVAYLVTLPAIAFGNYFGYKLWSFKTL